MQVVQKTQVHTALTPSAASWPPASNPSFKCFSPPLITVATSLRPTSEAYWIVRTHSVVQQASSGATLPTAWVDDALHF
jgi:hypothetical protein